MFLILEIKKYASGLFVPFQSFPSSNKRFFVPFSAIFQTKNFVLFSPKNVVTNNVPNSRTIHFEKLWSFLEKCQDLFSPTKKGKLTSQLSASRNIFCLIFSQGGGAGQVSFINL